MAQQGDSDTGNNKPRDDDVITAIKSRDFKTALSLVESFNASLKFVCPNSLTPLYLMCQKYEIREFSPLHIAAEHGHLGLFQYLLDLLFSNIPSTPPLSQDETLRRKQELILNLRDYKDNTLLHVASRRGKLDIVKLLTDTLGLDPNCTNLNDKSCLQIAAESGQLIVVRYLIEETGSDLSLIDKEGRCPSYLAAGGGHLNVLWGSDPHFKRKLGTSGRSLVHPAIEEGHLHVIRYLIDYLGCNPSCQGDDGITPLHLACKKGHMDIVKYLITEANCDPNCVSKDGMTCLHLASEWSRLDVIEYLTDKHQCIPKGDNEGNTPLHYAAGKLYNLAIDLVQFLIEKYICDPLVTNNKGETALDSAIMVFQSIQKTYGSMLQVDRSEVISYLRQVCTNSTRIKIPPTTINIFVVGNSGSGKSTLVKAISRDKSFIKRVFNLKIKGVVPLTPGIVPITLDHEIFGRVNIFDFAGHEEYYASHEMILCQSSHPLVLLVLNISLPLSEVEKQLQYWLAILSNASTNETCKIMHVIIIGSYADLINKSTTSKIENLISSTIKSRARIHFYGLIHFDCRYLTSGGMEQLCLQLGEISESIRSDIANGESYKSKKLCAALMNFITNELPAMISIKGAVTINELWKHYNSAASLGDSPELSLYFYPSPLHNKLIFIQTCQKLNLNGNILLIPHEHNIEESLLVLNNNIQVHACLKEIKQNISNDLGMLEEFRLKDILSDSLGVMDSHQAIEYLKFSQFCTEITPDQLLSAPDKIDRENHYFFPNLVLATRPSSSTLWRTEEGGHEYTDLYTWCMECTNARQFFTPRYIHTLFIQLVKCESGNDHAQCIIWKNGILLVHSNLTRCVIEVTDQTTRLYITLQCEKSHEKVLVKQRSLLISLIKSLKMKVCPEVESRELLFSPTHSYPPLPGSDSVPVTDVARSVLAGLPAVATRKDSMNINQVHISELLYCDSLHLNYATGSKTILQTILLNSCSSDIISSSVMRRMCTIGEPRAHISLTEIFQDTSDEELKEIPYKELYEELLKYTIFSDDTLFVSHLHNYNSCSY